MASLPWLAGLVLAQVPLPGTSSVSVPLSPPSTCARCHGDFDPERAAHDTWLGSAMGHAARDPLYLAALDVAEKDAPGVGDLCLRCHAPEAWLAGRCDPPDGSALRADDPGVTCSICHRMEPTPHVRNAQYVIGDDSEMRGPYADAMAPHHTRRSSWISDAKLCGTCHDVLSPLVRRVGGGSAVGGPFPEQTTYQEWAASAFADEGTTCQRCHMPESAGPVARDGPRRPDRSSHGFAGGNVFLLDAIEVLEPQLGIGRELALGRARIRANLAEAASLQLSGPSRPVSRGERIALAVRVTNLTGHKLPTGYPLGRRVWLSVSAPALGMELGGFDEASGEPVRPAAIYQAVHARAGFGPGHHLALNDVVLSDTRIPPRGMVATATIAPVGKTFATTSSGALAHWDDVEVAAEVPCDLRAASIEVRVKLWYQSTTKAYVETLVREAGSARSRRLSDAFAAVGAAPIEMESAAVTIAVDPASSCAPPDAGVVADAGFVADAASDAGFDAGLPRGADGGLDLRPDSGPFVDGEAGCACAAAHRPTSDGGGPGCVLGFLAWISGRSRGWVRRRRGAR